MRPVKESRACKSNKRWCKLQISLRFSLLSDSTSVVYPVNEAYAHRKGKRIDVNTTITGILSLFSLLFLLSLSHYFFSFSSPLFYLSPSFFLSVTPTLFVLMIAITRGGNIYVSIDTSSLFFTFPCHAVHRNAMTGRRTRTELKERLEG